MDFSGRVVTNKFKEQKQRAYKTTTIVLDDVTSCQNCGALMHWRNARKVTSERLVYDMGGVRYNDSVQLTYCGRCKPPYDVIDSDGRYWKNTSAYRQEVYHDGRSVVYDMNIVAPKPEEASAKASTSRRRNGAKN